jgi:hypothetical protein
MTIMVHYGSDDTPNDHAKLTIGTRSQGAEMGATFIRHS